MKSDMKPKISVWMTCYNQEKYIDEAVQSVLDQTLQPYEILISDDCSTDGTIKILEDFELKYPDLIKVYFQQVRLGITKNKNFIISKVGGDYITWLDGDDLFHPHKLEKEMECLKAFSSAKIVFSDVDCINDKGEFLHKWYERKMVERAFEKDINAPTLLTCFPAILKVDTRFAHQRNELIHKDVLDAVGMLNEDITLWQDYEYRIRLFKEFDAIYNPSTQQGYRYYQEASRYSSTKYFFEDLAYIYKKHIKNVQDWKLQVHWLNALQCRNQNGDDNSMPKFPTKIIFMYKCKGLVQSCGWWWKSLLKLLFPLLR